MNIIAVDDEALALRTLIKAIKKADYTANVTGFESPEEALQYAEKNKVDVAFLDIEMAEMNGLFLAKQLKDIYGYTYIIFVTGYNQYALDAFQIHASNYLLKPICNEYVVEALKNLYQYAKMPNEDVKIQCFGSFEIFVDDKPIFFKRARSKEILAYLVDRKGALVSTREMAAILWEDAVYDRSKQKQLNVFITEMTNVLADVGAGELIIKKRGYYAIDISKCYCDYYAYENGSTMAVNSYRGEYMANYSWAEFTAGWLTNKKKI